MIVFEYWNVDFLPNNLADSDGHWDRNLSNSTWCDKKRQCSGVNDGRDSIGRRTSGLRRKGMKREFFEEENMKKFTQISSVFVAFMAIFAVSCGGSASTPANKTANAANAANTSTRKPAGDAPMVAAPKIFEMVGKDEKGFNDQFKGREMIVIGEVDSAEAGSFYFYGGPGKTISCTMAVGESGDKLERLKTLVAGSPAKKPIVEAIAVFRSGAKMDSGDITVVMENCSIVSIKE